MIYLWQITVARHVQPGYGITFKIQIGSGRSLPGQVVRRRDGNYRCGSGLQGHTGARRAGDLPPVRRTRGLQAPPSLEGHVGRPQPRLTLHFHS